MTVYLLDFEETLLDGSAIPNDLIFDLHRWMETTVFVYLSSHMPYSGILRIVPSLLRDKFEMVISSDGTEVWQRDTLFRRLCDDYSIFDWLKSCHGDAYPFVWVTNYVERSALLPDGCPKFKKVQRLRKRWPGARVIKAQGPAHLHKLIHSRQL